MELLWNVQKRKWKSWAKGKENEKLLIINDEEEEEDKKNIIMNQGRPILFLVN